jgi:hypothetical protein
MPYPASAVTITLPMPHRNVVFTRLVALADVTNVVASRKLLFGGSNGVIDQCLAFCRWIFKSGTAWPLKAVIGRPFATAGGKNVHARARKVAQPAPVRVFNSLADLV